MGDLQDLAAVSPIFILMGAVLIAGYLTPVLLSRIDDMEIKKTIKKNRKYKNSKTQWKCKCGVLLINHGCYTCNTINDIDVQAWCPDCGNHPLDPIAC